MPIIYVDSVSGSNTSPYETKAKAADKLSTVDAFASAGDEILCSHAHAGTTSGSITLDFINSTLTAPIIIKSIDFSDDSYTLGAKETVTGGASDITFRGPHVQAYGITLDTDDDMFLGTSGDDIVRLEDCTLTIDDALQIGGVEGLVELISCTINSSETTTVIQALLESSLRLVDCTVTHPNSTTLLVTADNTKVLFDGCDLSSDSTNITNGITGNGAIEVVVRRCKMKTGWSLLGAGTINDPSNFAIAESCTDGTITLPEIPMSEYEEYAGTCTDVLTPDRTGGADDGFNGLYSRKMVTNANALEQFIALRSLDLSKRLTTNTTPSGATSRHLYTSTRMAPQGTPAALTTDGTSTWNGSGVGTKQKITHTLSSQNGATLTVFVASGGTLNDDDFWIEVHEPDQAGGSLFVEAFLAKPSTTVYVDVRLDVA